ncbi:ATP-binding cassette sub-family B member 6, mitochondrial [Psilocybe cubensis]|uniref:Mitochondrial half-size ABC transporter n=2 Tax=Psilocybe cubensis TaxID=181762 RepID=A0A8H7Y7R9_PSICU|nr:ATP-binding cassette sub-family B member 6, mitochondrial [Psilocybe cubensis]KAH9485276.1 ATP-binding cassette sub-family B member 6, mitochondrial [Psilocybe cubensis]
MIIMFLHFLTPLVPTFVARVLSPSIVFLSAFTLFSAHLQPPNSPSPITPVVVATAVPRRALILTLLSLIAFTYFLDGIAFVTFAVLDHHWPSRSGIPINTITGVIAFSGLAALGTWKDVHGIDVWSLKRVKVAVAASLALDLSLTVLLTLHLRQPETPVFTIRTLVHVVFPALRVLLLAPLLAGLVTPRITYSSVQNYDDIETPAVEPTVSTFLLAPESGPQSSTGLTAVPGPGENSKYGTFRNNRSTLQASVPTTRAATPAPSTGPDTKSEPKPEISFEPSWSELWARIRRLSPHLWPKKNLSLQFVAVICIIILLLGRVINLAMPITLSKLIDILEGRSNQSPWLYLLGYVGLRFLQGSGGLSAIRDSLWAPVMQYSDREMSQLSFDHLLNLSYAWHTRRKTGEILRVLDRGAAINRTLELVLFSILPTFIDIFVALVAFVYFFKWTLALVIFVVMFAYVSVSVILTTWRTRLRRQMNERDVATRGIHTDCLLNYETVKYFGGEEHEGRRYSEAIQEYQALEYKVILSLNLLNLVQNFIITSGLLIGSFMVAYEITSGDSPGASKFVFFITYLAQLYGPLNQLGYIYRSVNQSLVDTEKLLALLNEPTEVNDKENAADLVVYNGEIEFENVHFSYDGRASALNGVSFKVPKGGSLALVGESGAGKSTILRLLYRFYDLGEGQGRILIDGQDIRDVTQKSLRQAIGVVPQDSVLFNSSIRYNIGYGKFNATMEEIEAAAKSAQMHERIMSFPEGYNTKVGERGIRLSGGEKQRVAIARTLLKNPPILLLDEATSALDTSTEKDIQKALQNLVKGRSSVSIAHRLSTIASADVILVLKDGQVAEQGNFKELIELDGLFASMWADQISSNDELAVSFSDTSVKKEASGYNVGATIPSEAHAFEHAVEASAAEAIDTDISPVPATSNDEHQPEVSSQVDFPQTKHDSLVDSTPESDPQPSQEDSNVQSVVIDEQQGTQTKLPAVTSEIASPVASAPIAFPSSDSYSDIRREETPPPIVSPPTVSFPAVTFGASVNSPPSRIGTPDPESEPKRKRISSQNFQRLARRISLTTRRGSSSSGIPGLKREQSPKVSIDDSRPEGSGAGSSNDSPAASVKGDDKGKLKKKEKKEKSKKNTM